ncbi:sulfatase [Bacteroidota bacterium]
MRNLSIIFVLFVSALLSCTRDQAEQKPNIVIIFLDDSGWSDFEPFSTRELKTPNVTQLGREGCAYRNFYVPQAICSASRSALLTGCFPGRTKMFGAHGPNARGVEPSFATMAEVFKAAGYSTALFGKWHCGDQPDTRPHTRGFDESCGLMYSNDMWKHHPEKPEKWGKYPLQFWENGEVTIDDITAGDQKNLTKWYTEHAVDFINRHGDSPFLLYVPHSMPHVPIFCSNEFEGISGKGLYWDVILELDWSVGEINKALKKNGLEKNTIVIFSSDNGPWTSYGDHAGTTPYREAKATSFDGGVRSACIIKYPGHIETNSSSSHTFFSIDLLPSLCQIAGVDLPVNEIDGKNVWDLILGKAGAENPHDYYAISTGRYLESILSGDGRWKLHLPHGYRTLKVAGNDGQAGKYLQDTIEISLFDMLNDPFETENVIGENPEVAEKLHSYAESHLDRFYADQDN